MRPPLAVAFATVGFAALLIAGLGLLSLALDRDVIGVPGLGQAPGIVGTLLAIAAFAVTLGVCLRRPAPSFLGALWCTVAAFLGYLAGLALGALFTGADVAAAAAAVGSVATSWFGAVVALAGLIAGWGGVALVRTRSDRPKWPWERAEDE